MSLAVFISKGNTISYNNVVSRERNNIQEGMKNAVGREWNNAQGGIKNVGRNEIAIK